jgi:hypothetical protein
MRFTLDITANDEVMNGERITPQSIVNAALKGTASLLSSNGGEVNMGLYRAKWGLVTEKAPDDTEANVAENAVEGM